MKKTFLFALSALALGQIFAQTNTLLDQSFWRAKPDVAAVKAEVEKGNNPLEFNAGAFDPTTLAINQDAPIATVKYLLEQSKNDVKRKTHDARIYLHWAAYRGNVELVEYLLGLGSDINEEDSHGTTPVAFAAGSGGLNKGIVEAFVKKGLDLKKTYRDGANLLLLGVGADKDLSLTDYLVSKGLSINSVDAKGNTAFNYAARGGDIELLKALLKKGVKYNNEALIAAAQGSRRTANTIEVYKYLVEDLKLKPNFVSASGETVLHSIVRKPNQSEIIKYFLDKGVDVNQATKEDGATAFLNAASGRDLAVLEQLAPKVKDINYVNKKGESALSLAVKGSTAEVVTFLIGKGANVNVKDNDGNTLVAYLIESYRPQMGGGRGGAQGAEGARPQQDDFTVKLNLLKEKGLDFATLQQEGNSIYHLAVTKNDTRLLQKLADFKIDLNIKNKEGNTALHKAALIAKDDKVLKFLVNAGADKSIKTDFDETAFELAKENNNLTKNNISVDFLK
ncbi:ankyrin repeat domain-containing protein [Polluticaenibacter yanchengensis]|uniref:Ankyrin repeat domain-containing protein n=1 Tax=Polluticaenibacter yanchengensis TaxID=3014562 RepID=A0ABT4UFJ7_9BACT|nr:ankyrin repeat domain-containing protein [Chitinophagaceae bacterium LY-5]